MQPIRYEDIDSARTRELINNRASFEIIGLSGRMGSAVAQIENLIETHNLTCRVYTFGRVVAAGGSLFGGITGVLGVASAIGMAAHNLATYDPDYEIAKHLVDNKLLVDYRR